MNKSFYQLKTKIVPLYSWHKSLMSWLKKRFLNLEDFGITVGMLVVISLVIFDAANKNAPEWLYMTAVAASVAFLKGFKDNLQDIRDNGLPFPVAYIEDIGFDWILKTETDKQIYIGYVNQEVIKWILTQPISNSRIIINIDAFSKLKKSDRVNIFNQNCQNGEPTLTLSNTPIDHIAVFEYNQGICQRATLIRKAIDSINSFYAIRYTKNSILLKQVSDLHKNNYQENSSISIGSNAMLNFFPKYHEERDVFNISTLGSGGNIYNFYHREEFFDRSSTLIQEAKTKILGIDLTPFENWNDDQVFMEYLNAHSRNAEGENLIKQRVKIIDLETAKKNKPSINAYIKKMEEIGVELRFFDIKGSNETNGAVLIDSEVCIDFSLPEAGSTYGTISFIESHIIDKTRKFEFFWSKGMPLNEFKNENALNNL